jgi:hypothetical protein
MTFCGLPDFPAGRIRIRISDVFPEYGVWLTRYSVATA